MRQRKNKQRAFVAMSGGVDSSVAALLLKRKGYDVVGVFMRCYNIDGCAERDAEDARRVAEQIGIPFYVWNFEEEYKRRVVDYMIDGYRRGITPNPDVMCNREIKFGLFLKKALAMGADFVATGHYVRLRRARGGDVRLYRAVDLNKDQSYFLWTLTQKQLQRCLFPIGDYAKPEVRRIAKAAGLITAEKKDSQGICFLGKVPLPDFLKRYTPEKKGKVLAETGEIIGTHRGAHFYTIGQRHIGAAIRRAPGLSRGGDFKPLYVVGKDITANTVTVAEGNKNPALYRKEIILTDVNFIRPAPRFTLRGASVMARVRYRQPLAPAKLCAIFPSRASRRLLLRFAKPQKFVAPGQSAVFYSINGRASVSAKGTTVGREMLGGGVIV